MTLSFRQTIYAILFINEPFVQAFELKSFVIPVVNLINRSLIFFFCRNCSMICAGVIFLTCRCDLPCEIKSYKCVEFLHLPPATLKYQFMINQHKIYRFRYNLDIQCC